MAPLAPGAVANPKTLRDCLRTLRLRAFPEMKTIAEQDAALPPCRRPDGLEWRCTVCQGSPLQHHWMFGSPDDDGMDDEDEDSEWEMILICRHCPARITDFDCEDPNCPAI